MTREVFIGIDCGGTRSVAIAASATGELLRRVESGPANLRLLTDVAVTRHFRLLAKSLPLPAAIGVGMAGARGQEDNARIRRLAGRVWKEIPCSAHHDLETALAAAGPLGNAKARVIVLSGTGSCCYGRAAAGRAAKVGGWGHLLGDKASGYEIGMFALRATVSNFDRARRWTLLGQRILTVLALSGPEELIPWVQSASKTDVARLAIEVFAAAKQRDFIALRLLREAADTLARDAIACARRLARPSAKVEFVFAGSVLTKQAAFAQTIGQRIRRGWPGARVLLQAREAAWGGIELARRLFESEARTAVRQPGSIQPAWIEAVSSNEENGYAEGFVPHSLKTSPTEQRNPRSKNLDVMGVSAAVGLMLREESMVNAGLRRVRGVIVRAVRLVSRALARGGRLFYIGAGTSGRLGVLDASECPPTFRTKPSMVQGIIAGGQRALWSAVEGAEDDLRAGARAVEFGGITAKDVVFGIAASGRTPFVWGAFSVAKERGAATVLLCFNPYLRIPAAHRPSVVIAASVGAEILTGSTRLKAGTATKLVLNMVTTLAMVRLGKVSGNLMVDLNPSNAKLKDRAARIVCELSGCDYATAWNVLDKSHWNVKAAVRRANSQSSEKAK